MHALYYINSYIKNNNGLLSVKTLTIALSRDASMTLRGIYACTVWRRQRHCFTYLKGADLSDDPGKDEKDWVKGGR